MRACSAIKKKTVHLGLVLMTLGVASPTEMRAQSDSLTKILWLSVEAQLQEQPDSSPAFIVQRIRSLCGQDLNCQFHTLRTFVYRLERSFNLPTAIYLAEELAKVASENSDPLGEAKAYNDIHRYHSAMGNHRLAVVHLDQAFPLYRQAGDSDALLIGRMSKLQTNEHTRPLEEIYPEMEALVTEAETGHLDQALEVLHTRLIYYAMELGRYEDAERHISFLESTSLSEPIQPDEYGIAIHAARGRADLYRAQGRLDEAAEYYQRALRLCEQQPNRWQEINLLQMLAELDWERGRRALAKAHLAKAGAKAQELELEALLARNFALLAQFAESEGRYADALAYTKKNQFHQERFDSRSAGFDLQNYYLGLERERLEVDKENQSLELSLRKNQLRNSLIIIGLSLLLVAGLLIGLYWQRQGKRELAAQNDLIRQQAEQLASLDAAKSRFFANVSHELRTPLTLLLGPIQTLLKGGQLNDKQRQLLQMATQSGKQLEELVAEILDLRKLEMGKMELKTEPTELNVFFRRITAQFESLAQRKGIDFRYEMSGEREAVVEIDLPKFRQVVQNLLSNAFKYTPAGGLVEARLSYRDGRLQLRVADSGAGIHPDDLPHVFDRFFQTTRPDKPAEGGTGIGLALCREYARLFGGAISVESALGRGAVFLVEFPVLSVGNWQLAGADDTEPVQLAGAGERERGGEGARELPSVKLGRDEATSTILVVEDNPELQDYIRLILSEKYEVVTAENGREALDYLLSDTDRQLHLPPGNCHLILSDLMMPVMDGFQLLEQLKSNAATRQIPVIMLTARADLRDKLHALRIGVDDYLLKPFDEEELVVRIENLLRNQVARQEESSTDDDEPSTPARESEDEEWLDRFENYLQQNLSSDILNVPMIASEFAMSESTLLRQLKRLTGLTPAQYLLEMRLDHARRLLETGDFRSIAQLAAEVGYTDSRSFSRSFKKRFGKLPSEFGGN